MVTVDGEFLTDEPTKLLEQGFVVLGINKSDGGSLVKNARFPANEESDLMKESILYQYTSHSVPDSTRSIEQ